LKGSDSLSTKKWSQTIDALKRSFAPTMRKRCARFYFSICEELIALLRIHACTYRSAPPSKSGAEMRGDAKVDQLDVRRFGQQDVVALDIPVHAVLLVQVHQRLRKKYNFVIKDIIFGDVHNSVRKNHVIEKTCLVKMFFNFQ
jgi:hypothetical protein